MDLTVNLKKDPGQSLGIGFKKLAKPPHCQVFKMVENGVATGLVNKGDLLLSINGLNVQHLCPAEIGSVLERFINNPSLVLEVRRSLANGNLNSNNSDLVQNGHPAIEVEPTSPDRISMDSDSPSPSQDMFSTRTSVPGQRTRRTMFMESKALPLIEEGSDHKCNGMQLLNPGHPVASQRHSFTPEAVRKPLEELRKTKMRSCKSLDLGVLPQWRTGNMQSVTIHNLLDGNELTDRLFAKRIPEYPDTGCTDQLCKGSHMKLKPKRPYATPRPKEEILPLAKDFMSQYFDSKKVALGHDYENKLSVRLWQIHQEIEETGTYSMTYEELVFAARTAWRNAPRCVNRIVWRQLEVLDARDVTNPKEMFDAICHHIKYANNGGNLRSTITVFPHRTRKNCDFRVWNPQLIQYAGYKTGNTILGDPANVDLTEVCMDHLDWTPPAERSEFDILPIILQANGGEPELFEIPSEIIIEVQLCHPEYDWFKNLGLRWYALPAVSGMLLDCGGLEFPGIPFNGWYMGTEIARDLGDSNRYNKLKLIAQGLGLNTQTYKLWKDRAVIELNVAVLHSYQSNNVSVVDHHSTTESFITHMKSEMLVRGGCPADWVWIVPPISGSTTPVFHQEMNMYNLSPSYEYQHTPWRYHNWTSTDGRKKSGTFAGPHRFKRLAKLVGINALMYRKVYQKRIKATVLFATETGRARNYANVVKDVFGRVFAAKVCCMEDYDKTNLEHEQILILVTSTFGSGDPPANGESFGRYILDLRNGSALGSQTAPTPRSHRMSTIVAPTPTLLDTSNKNMDRLLTQVKYAVFGLGSRAYPNFCTFAHTCDNLLKDLGAEVIQCCGEGDELCGQEESFQGWLQQCYHHACQLYSIDPERTEGDLEGYQSGYSKENYRVQAYLKPEEGRSDLCTRLKGVHSKNIQPFIIKSRSKLQSALSDRSTILVVLGTSDNNVHYEPGDHIAIYPQNSAKLVNQLISVLNPQIDPDEPIYVESRRVSHSKEHWVEEKRMPVPVTLRGALTYYLDISNPPSPQFIKLLAKQATRSTEQEELNELSKGGEKYEDWKYGRFPDLCDVFSQFHSLKVDVTLLLQQLPLLQCRYYSISSSPKMYPNEVHITVAVVSFKKRSAGPWHNGVCSTWLNKLEMGSRVPSVIRQAHAFHLPSDARTPVIMIGPGTGIAPYRSFWQERLHIRNLALKMHLTQPSTPTKVKPQTISLAKTDMGGGKRRRKTAYLPPNLSLLQAPKDEVDSPSPNVSSSTVPMRRSLSDTDQNEEIAKMLATKQKSWGNMTMYFGCRRHDLDYIYKDELVKAKVSGALSEVYVAFSREPGKPKKYVQHLLKENADRIVREMMEERGHVYVCGDISMAADVCRTIQSIFEENAAMSSEEARSLIESLKDRGFYHEDIFGVTLKHNEVTARVRTAAKKRIMVNASDSIHSIKSPMTPSLRMASPFRVQSHDVSSASYDSSTGGRNFSKRLTPNALSPSVPTFPDGRARTIASPETKRAPASPDARTRKHVGDSRTSPKPRAKVTLHGTISIDDSYIVHSSSLKPTTIEEPRKTVLEPLSEVEEQAEGQFRRIPSIDVSSPACSEKVASQAALFPVGSAFPSTSKLEEPTKTGIRKTAEDKKKAQRIRTKSKVETVL